MARPLKFPFRKPSIYSIAGKLSLMTLAVVLLTNLITVGFMQYQAWQRFEKLPPNLKQVLQQKGDSFYRNAGPPAPNRDDGEVRFQVVGNGAPSGAYTPKGPLANLNWVTPLYTPQQNWNVLFEQPRTVRVPKGLRLRDDLQISLLWSTLIGCLLGAGLSVYFSRRLARPLESVAHAAAQVSSGDLSTRVKMRKVRRPQQDEVYHLTQHFNRMAETLERQEQERKNMIADIAHELRTPIAVMKAKLDALEDGIVPLDLQSIQRLQVQTNLLSRLVDDLRTLSLADAGKLDLSTQVVDIAALVENVVSEYQTIAHRENVNVEVHTSHETILIPGDPDRLAQVISNLLENAVRYTPPEGQIQVQVTRKQDTVHIQVQDSGHGIPEHALEHIFERFYRADGSRNRGTGGTGLGLAIVRTLTELHGGRVRAWNQKGSGAVFLVELQV
ncbi:sensor histidine kinase [Deinococcus misasensis]|uniref:sensor histidine kinase n=1 Tax=Deinococcus misasensis TaxID=392413 RepID=UPI000A0263A1|nr:ATP-binding protein [Deinococcus misasensis]